MDNIIDTVCAPHPILPLIALLKTNGKLIVVGQILKPPELPYAHLMMGKFSNSLLFAFTVYTYMYYTCRICFQFVGTHLLISL